MAAFPSQSDRKVLKGRIYLLMQCASSTAMSASRCLSFSILRVVWNFFVEHNSARQRETNGRKREMLAVSISLSSYKVPNTCLE